MNIIYVEDDPINALVVERFLKNYQCKIFTSGEEAVNFCKSNSVDLVLMDINLGVDCMDGVQAMKEIKKLDHLDKIPVIAVTAYALPEDKQRFLNEGFDYYLSKPVSRDTLINTIQTLGPNY